MSLLVKSMWLEVNAHGIFVFTFLQYFEKCVKFDFCIEANSDMYVAGNESVIRVWFPRILEST